MKKTKIILSIILLSLILLPEAHAFEQNINSNKQEAMLLALKELEQESVQPEEADWEEEFSEDLFAPSLQKGAWTLKKGELYTEIYTKYYWHKHQFKYILA